MERHLGGNLVPSNMESVLREGRVTGGARLT